METWLKAFADVGPLLDKPLMLIGFALLLFFGILYVLLKAGFIPQLTPQTGGKVVQTVLLYGFILALVVTLLGFALQFIERPPPVDVDSIIERLMDSHQHEVAILSSRHQAELADWRKQVSEAVSALADLRGQPNAPPGIDQAFDMLEQGRPEKARTVFQTIVEQEEEDKGEIAASYRHLGALAFLDNREKALGAYRNATTLDPDHADGWNQLGHLYLHDPNLEKAEEAYRKAKALAESQNNQSLLAAAYGNLGNVYRIRGDLKQAEEMCRKALALFQGIETKQLAPGYLRVRATSNRQPYAATVEVYPAGCEELVVAKDSTPEEGARFALVPGIYGIKVKCNSIPNSPTVDIREVEIKTDETVVKVAECKPLVGTCQNPLEIRCGDTIKNARTTGGAQDSKLDGYFCTPGARYDGPENVYIFQPTRSSAGVTIKLSSMQQDLDLFALEEACTPEACAVGGHDALYERFLRGETWYIVVDGYKGASGVYDLTVECN